jgi:ABC-type transport system involved in cytochrome c biogenesis permease subunit
MLTCFVHTGSYAVPESWELPEGWDVEKNAWMPGRRQAAAFMHIIHIIVLCALYTVSVHVALLAFFAMHAHKRSTLSI